MTEATITTTRIRWEIKTTGEYFFDPSDYRDQHVETAEEGADFDVNEMVSDPSSWLSDADKTAVTVTVLNEDGSSGKVFTANSDDDDVSGENVLDGLDVDDDAE